MSALALLSMLVIGAMLQAVLPSWIIFGSLRPPILVGLVVYYALTRERSSALRAAFLAGIFQDAMSMIPLGYSSFVLCLIAWLINAVRDNVYVRNWVTHALFGGLAAGVSALLTYVLLRQGGLLELGMSALPRRLLGAVLAGALTVPVTFHLVDMLDRRLGIVEMGEMV